MLDLDVDVESRQSKKNNGMPRDALSSVADKHDKSRPKSESRQYVRPSF